MDNVHVAKQFVVIISPNLINSYKIDASCKKSKKKIIRFRCFYIKVFKYVCIMILKFSSSNAGLLYDEEFIRYFLTLLYGIISNYTVITLFKKGASFKAP